VYVQNEFDKNVWAQSYIGYMGPLTLYLYFKYGRAKLLERNSKATDNVSKHMDETHEHAQHDIEKDANDHTDHHNDHTGHDTAHNVSHGDHQDNVHADHNPMITDSANHGASHDVHKDHMHDMHNMSGHHMHDMGGDRPFWATVFIGVSHCGAGCVLGDLVGEWLIYGTGAMIRGHDIWPALLVDYGFALLFGIVFQYFSIAPMSGDYGPKTIIRAAKADVLSLTAFEVGLFGWMIIYQVGIWNYKLEMNTWTVRLTSKVWET
jgi:hypothetical protein